MKGKIYRGSYHSLNKSFCDITGRQGSGFSQASFLCNASNGLSPHLLFFMPVLKKDVRLVWTNKPESKEHEMYGVLHIRFRSCIYTIWCLKFCFECTFTMHFHNHFKCSTVSFPTHYINSHKHLIYSYKFLNSWLEL